MRANLRNSTLAGLSIAIGLLVAAPLVGATAAPTEPASPAIANSVHARSGSREATFGSALRGTAPTGDGPSTVAVDPGTKTAYVGNGNNANGPNAGGSTLSVIDTRRCRALDVRGCVGPWPTVTVGNGPNTLAVDPVTHTVYVTNVLDNTVSVVDGRTCNGRVTSGCDQTATTIPVGTSPTGIFFDQRTKTVYVGSFDDDTVSVFSGATCNGGHAAGCPTTPPPAFAVGGGPGDIDVNQRTHTGYVATLTGLTVFDTRSCNATTRTGCATTGTFTLCTGPCFGAFTAKVDPRTNTIYEADGGTSLAAIDGSACNAENLTGCETAGFGIVALPPVFFEHILWIGVDSKRHTVYALQQKNDTVIVIDTRVCNGTHVERCATLKPRSVHTGPDPEGLALDERTHTLYVANQVGDSMSVIDTARCNAEVAAGCRRRPPSVAVPGAGAIAVDSSRATAYVATAHADADHGAVAMVDTQRCNARHPAGCGRQPATVPVQGVPQAIAVDQEAHTVYVATGLTETTGTVSVLDARACDAHPTVGCGVAATVRVNVGNPTAIAVNTKTHAVYVGATTPTDDSTVIVFRGATCNAATTRGCSQKLGVMSFGPPRGPSEACGGWYVGVAVNPATNTVYATNTEACGGRGRTVSVFDGSTCGATTRSGCGPPAARVVAGLNPLELAVDETTNTVYTALLADGEFPSSVAVIDSAHCNAMITSGCRRSPTLAPTVFGSIGVAVDPGARFIYVTNVEDTSVSAVDIRQCNGTDTSGCARPSAALPADDYPSAVAIDPRVQTAYVTSSAKGTVSVVALL